MYIRFNLGLLKIFPVKNSVIKKSTEMLDIYINICQGISILCLISVHFLMGVVSKGAVAAARPA